MPYSAQADIEDSVTVERLRQLTDDESAGVVNPARVVKAITAADDLIDSYIRGTHTVPLSPVPTRIRQVSVDIATYYLYKRRREMEMPDDLVKDYDRQISFLRDVQSGKVLLDTPTAAPNKGGMFKTNKTSESRVFNSEVMGGY